MIMDRTLLFSDRQAITATAASTNVVDLGAARNMSPGKVVPLAIAVTETFNNLTSLAVSIETDDNAAFSSATTVATGVTYPAADLVAGKQLLLPDVLTGKERFVRLKYTVVGTAPTTGRITAGVTAGNQSA